MQLWPWIAFKIALCIIGGFVATENYRRTYYPSCNLFKVIILMLVDYFGLFLFLIAGFLRTVVSLLDSMILFISRDLIPALSK